MRRIIYIHEQPEWPDLTWDAEKLSLTLGKVRHRQGKLTGYMEGLGFSLRSEAELETLIQDVVKSNEIEGEKLNREEVRSSIARHLGLDIAGLIPADRNVEGVVEMMLDATQNYRQPLTKKRLFAWHSSLFPTGRSGMHTISTGAWRDHEKGPMQVVSGAAGKEKVHFEAPGSERLENEMQAFLYWFNHENKLDPVLKAAVAHIWFITIHPFDDGNGRIARAIADMQLTRADEGHQRFYSMSAQIRKERNGYYEILEKTQKGKPDITKWMEWFLQCMDSALIATGDTLSAVLNKAKFWERHAAVSLNERQRLMVNKLFDGFQGNLTSSKWAKITKCSADTALRDIQNLVEKEILRKDAAGGRSTNYLLNI